MGKRIHPSCHQKICWPERCQKHKPCMMAWMPVAICSSRLLWLGSKQIRFNTIQYKTKQSFGFNSILKWFNLRLGTSTVSLRCTLKQPEPNPIALRTKMHKHKKQQPKKKHTHTQGKRIFIGKRKSALRWEPLQEVQEVREGDTMAYILVVLVEHQELLLLCLHHLYLTMFKLWSRKYFHHG
jgi:hypothetical protein